MLAEEVTKDPSRNYGRQFRPFEKARQFARGLGLKNKTEWGQYCYGELHEKTALPEDIPKYPSESYRDSGWVSWDNWLGRVGSLDPPASQ
jgi:hypothetical protein